MLLLLHASPQECARSALMLCLGCGHCKTFDDVQHSILIVDHPMPKEFALKGGKEKGWTFDHLLLCIPVIRNFNECKYYFAMFKTNIALLNSNSILFFILGSAELYI